MCEDRGDLDRDRRDNDSRDGDDEDNLDRDCRDGGGPDGDKGGLNGGDQNKNEDTRNGDVCKEIAMMGTEDALRPALYQFCPSLWLSSHGFHCCSNHYCSGGCCSGNRPLQKSFLKQNNWVARKRRRLSFCFAIVGSLPPGQILGATCRLRFRQPGEPESLCVCKQ